MAQIPNEIKQDPNWARAVAISKQYAVSTYPATWVLKFINEWNAAVQKPPHRSDDAGRWYHCYTNSFMG